MQLGQDPCCLSALLLASHVIASPSPQEAYNTASPAGTGEHTAYLVTLILGFVVLLAALWGLGGLAITSRYVGVVGTLYVIISLLLLALRYRSPSQSTN